MTEQGRAGRRCVSSHAPCGRLTMPVFVRREALTNDLVTGVAMRAWGHIGRGFEGKRCVRKHSISLSMAMSRYARLALASLSAIVLACHNDPGGPATRTDPDTGLISFVSVRSGDFHTCGLALTGTYCWGFGDSVPSRVRGGMRFSAVETNAFAACGLTTTGAPYCWGPCAFTTSPLYCPDPRPWDAFFGLDDSLPVLLPGHHEFSAITGGSGGTGPDHWCGLTTDGAAYCWGGNAEGELGDGTTTGSEFAPGGWPVRRAPVAVVGGLQFRSIVAGFAKTCGLTLAGVAYCWGINRVYLDNGTLGTGDTTSAVITAPRAVAGGHTFSMLTSADGHLCGIADGGAAYCWGTNRQTGALGDGSTVSRSIPVAVATDLTFATLSAGGSGFTCGLTMSGEAYCWGTNDMGQLGIGARTGPENCLTTPSTPLCSTRPLRVLTDLRFSSISAGERQICGLSTQGIVYCWGSNSNGELGDAHAPNAYCESFPVASPGVGSYRYCTVPVKVARQR